MTNPPDETLDETKRIMGRLAKTPPKPHEKPATKRPPKDKPAVRDRDVPPSDEGEQAS